jgi:hypothetical protein
MRTLPPRPGFGRRMIAAATALVSTNISNRSRSVLRIQDKVHPDYTKFRMDWAKWRSCYKGGDEFVDEYLKKFSRRETNRDYRRRKEITPTSAHAKAAINDVKNAIFQRIADVSRTGGPTSYSSAMDGNQGGVDLKGSTMNWFIGQQVIHELILMGRVGVFVDMPAFQGQTLADKGNNHPYLYVYQCEQILNWSYSETRELETVLLEDNIDVADSETYLTIGTVKQARLLFINADGTVTAIKYDDTGAEFAREVINIKRIPFVIMAISGSLMEDIANHQIAVMNLNSSDIGFTLLANFPMYVEQTPENFNAPHLKRPVIIQSNGPKPPGTPTTDPNGITGDDDCNIDDDSEDEKNINAGASHGRRYGKGLDKPDFINPSPEPLKASMAKQDQLKDEIRTLVTLTLSTIKPTMASAESKSLDQQGLESGLSAIGLELEHGENEIAIIWSLYEGTPNNRAQIRYPKRYSLKSDEDRRKEATDMIALRSEVPSVTLQREISKQAVTILIGDRVSASTLSKIMTEIDNAPGTTGNLDEVLNAIKGGLTSRKAGAKLTGFPEDQLEVAAQEEADRLARIAASQTKGQGTGSLAPTNPAARGLPGDPNPASGQLEKIGKPQRGVAANE